MTNNNPNQALKNIAIIAHVDHGKTTLIDGLFRQAGVFQSHKTAEDRIMDSGELEKERGITIKAKNASFGWKNAKVNIIDTPGHADFGGEVERALCMVDGALLLVDAAEGPLPQTRFVLQKALERGIKITLVINKVDRSDARIEEVEEKVLELFYDLATSDDQVSYSTFYASAKNGWASKNKEVQKDNFDDLLDAIVNEVPQPKVDTNGLFSLMVANRTHSSFLGQIAIGRIESGSVKIGQQVVIIDEKNNSQAFQVSNLECYSGLGTKAVKELQAGEIALIAGVKQPNIGDTITTPEHNKALPRLKIGPSAVSVRISVNTGPFAGQDGEYLTSRKLEKVLLKACETNVSIQVKPTESTEVFQLQARGELQVVVLLEELRRQGYEFMVSRPEIIPLVIDDQEMEPEEMMVVDVPENMIGGITELLSGRGGKIESLENLKGSSRVRLEFAIPTRGLIGIRSSMLTKTKGEAVFSSSHKGYIPYQGKRFSRKNGALVCDRSGVSVEYGLYHLEGRGTLFLGAQVKVYEGMLFGENKRQNDINANPTKEKKLSNMRASGKDESTRISPPHEHDLDSALEWIDEDEWVEVTPKAVRLRKSELRTNMRQIIRR